MATNRIYLDHAATSFPKPAAVTERMVQYLTKVGSNVNRGVYGSAFEAEELLYSLRQAVTDLFGGTDCRYTAFTANVTTALNMIIKGLLRPGDHVLVSAMEHNAVMRPLHQLAVRGVRYDVIPSDRCGNMLLEEAEGMLLPETRAVICTHASNVCGTVQPIAALGQLCRRHDLLLIVDSAQTAGLFPLHMEEMNLAALAFTGHKTLLGPQGTGGFLLRPDLVGEMEPLIAGGTGSISHLEQMPDFMPDRFEAGTPNLPGLYGLYGALEARSGQSRSAALAHELDLTARFLEGLRAIPRIRLIGREDTVSRAPVVSVQIREGELAEAARLLDSRWGIQTRVGLHCAPLAHRTLGTYPQGTLRFSFGEGNTAEETNLCLEALEEICRTLPARER